MKHLLSGIAILAALAIAAPVSTQAQTSSGARPARPKAPPTAHASGKHAAAAHRRAQARGAGSAAAPGDNVANQLNGQELQRLQASSAPPMAAPRGAPAIVDEGPRVSGGGYIAPGQAGPVSRAPGAATMGPRDSGGGYIPAPTGPLPMPPPQPVAAPPR